MCCPEVASEDAGVLVIVDASPDMDTNAVVVCTTYPDRARDACRASWTFGGTLGLKGSGSLLFSTCENSGQRDGSLLGDMAAEVPPKSCVKDGWEDASVLVMVDASPDMDTTAVVAMDLRGVFRVGLLFTASANAGQRDGSLLGDMDADSTES